MRIIHPAFLIVAISITCVESASSAELRNPADLALAQPFAGAIPPQRLGGFVIEEPEDPKRKALREYFEKLPEMPFAVHTEAGPYDLTEAWKTTGTRLPTPQKLREFVLYGKVFQVTRGGLLVRSGGDLRFLKNHPAEHNAIDGQEIAAVCVPVGRHQYTSVTGAAQTIPKYDCGKRITRDRIPEQIKRVTPLGVYDLKRP